jgi:hypothetical protein
VTKKSWTDFWITLCLTIEIRLVEEEGEVLVLLIVGDDVEEDFHQNLKETHRRREGEY